MLIPGTYGGSYPKSWDRNTTGRMAPVKKSHEKPPTDLKIMQPAAVSTVVSQSPPNSGFLISPYVTRFAPHLAGFCLTTSHLGRLGGIGPSKREGVSNSGFKQDVPSFVGTESDRKG